MKILEKQAVQEYSSHVDIRQHNTLKRGRTIIFDKQQRATNRTPYVTLH